VGEAYTLLGRYGEEDAETGYNTYPLRDEEGLLCWNTFMSCEKWGGDLQKKFPTELDFDYNGIRDAENNSDGAYDLIEENQHSRHIYRICKSLTDVYGFYTAYIAELIDDDELELSNTPTCNIEPCLMELAACKIEIDEGFAPKAKEFRRSVTNNYEEWLNIVKDKAFRSGAPLRAELMEMVFDSHNELGHNAEAESLGFNSSRVHPDIYMNELLCGMRVIHQVLPVIMKKLGIEDEFQLDTSELRIG